MDFIGDWALYLVEVDSHLLVHMPIDCSLPIFQKMPSWMRGIEAEILFYKKDNLNPVLAFKTSPYRKYLHLRVLETREFGS